MRRVISGIIIIFATTLLSGCFSNNFEQNQIASPEPVNMEIHGNWKVVNKVVVDENLTEKTRSDVSRNYDTITISKDYVSFGDTYIENPKFKLKRVKKSSLLKGELRDTELEGFEELDEFVDIIDIYDNNSIYFNFIKNDTQNSSEDNHFIYIAGILMEVEKTQNAPEAVALNISNRSVDSINSEAEGSNILSIDRNYYAMDSGVLLGLKNSGNNKVDGTIEDATYRTLWISLRNGDIQPVKELDNALLVPRLNGFSKIQLESTEHYWGEEERLIITSNKKGEEAIKNILEEKNVCKEITFVGSNYIGLGYYNVNNVEKGYEEYKIIPIDSINNTESIDLISIFGENAKESYSAAKRKAEEINKINTQSTDVYMDDYRNINLARKNGQWVVEARAMEESNKNKYIDFSINLSPINTLINYDSIILPWNKLKEFNLDIRDSVSSPNARMILVLANEELAIYESLDGKIGEKLTSIPVEADESIVMSEWATGDFVTYWDGTVDEYNGKIINK